MEMLLIIFLSLVVSDGYQAVVHPGPSEAYCINVEESEIDESL